MPTNIIESSQELSDNDFFCLISILLQSLVMYNYNLVTSTWVCSIPILSSVGGYYPAPLALLLCTCQWSMSSLASPVLLGSQWVNPCLRSPMHEWAARAAKPENWPSQITKDWLSSIRLHWGILCFIPGNGAHVCWIEERYMVIHTYGITLNTAKSVDQYHSSYSYQSSSLISYFMYNDLHHDCKPYEQTR